MAEKFHIDWRSDEVKMRLKLLRAKGLSASQIAAELGQQVSRNAVIGAMHRHLEKRERAPARPASPPPARVETVTLSPIVLPLRRVTEGDEPAPKRAVPLRVRKPRDPVLDDARAELFGKPSFVVSRPNDSFANGFAGQQGRVSLVDLEPHHCRFPIDMPDGALMFCGLPKHSGRSWCAHHTARCENP